MHGTADPYEALHSLQEYSFITIYSGGHNVTVMNTLQLVYLFMCKHMPNIYRWFANAWSLTMNFKY